MSRNPFTEYLAGLEKSSNRAALAQLRRGLGKEPGTVPVMFPYVTPWIPRESSGKEQAAYYTLAALFGGHPNHSDAAGSLAATLREYVRRKPLSEQGVERRLVALLNSHADDLPNHLRHAIALVKGADVPVNYDKLLTHLRHWEHEDRWVQREWAKDYWGFREENSEEDQSNNTTNNKENE